jgi:rfaE bifunctional protein kinase chain/domain
MHKILVTGHFNVIHPGHLRLLRFAKELGGNLIVGVESDELAGSAAHVPVGLRLENVKNIGYVSESFIFDTPVNELIRKLMPDIVVKGKEHEFRENPELYALNEYGGKLIFSSGEATFSSLDLIRKEIDLASKQWEEIPEKYIERHGISVDRLKKLLSGFGSKKIIVIGDLIIDEYITCQPLGMSREDPVIVVTPIDTVNFVGGAGIVALHAANLGAKVDFISVIGDDISGNFAKRNLEHSAISAYLQIESGRPTTLKQRFRSSGKNLFRVSHLRQDSISLEIQNKIIDIVKPLLKNADALIFSDFNYGVLPQGLVDELIREANQCNVFIAADSQSSSQMGDVTRFKGVNLLTPTEYEARVSIKNNEIGLAVLVETIRERSQAKNILLKMGEEGLLVHGFDGQDGKYIDDQLPALNINAKDVAGAGDSMLVATTLAAIAGANIWEAALCGSIAAAIQVAKVGNVPISVQEMIKVLEG